MVKTRLSRMDNAIVIAYDVRSQSIDLVLLEYSGFATRRVHIFGPKHMQMTLLNAFGWHEIVVLWTNMHLNNTQFLIKQHWFR